MDHPQETSLASLGICGTRLKKEKSVFVLGGCWFLGMLRLSGVMCRWASLGAATVGP